MTASAATPAARRLERLRSSSEGAFKLARLLSLAVVAEPALIRAVRLELLPGVGADAEADLWFSGAVEARAPNGIVFDPQAAELLRRVLPRADAPRAWALIGRFHAHLSPALRLEEELNWLSLDAGANAAAIEALLRRAVGALVGAKQEHLANWAGRALPRLPEKVRALDAATMLATASDARLGRPLALPARFRAQGIPPWLYALLPRVEPREVGVRLDAAGLQIGPADMPGSQRIRVPATEPMIVEVSWREGTARLSTLVLVRAGEMADPVRVVGREVRLRTLEREEYVLRRSDRPTTIAVPATLVARAYASSDAVIVAWRSDAPIERCLGFALERRVAGLPTVTVLPNRRRFAPEAAAPGEVTPSTVAPIQAFRWMDHGAPRDADVEYRVVPVLGEPGALQVAADHASNWTSPVRVGVLRDRPAAAVFNRGTLGPAGRGA